MNDKNHNKVKIQEKCKKNNVTSCAAHTQKKARRWCKDTKKVKTSHSLIAMLMWPPQAGGFVKQQIASLTLQKYTEIKNLWIQAHAQVHACTLLTLSYATPSRGSCSLHSLSFVRPAQEKNLPQLQPPPLPWRYPQPWKQWDNITGRLIASTGPNEGDSTSMCLRSAWSPRRHLPRPGTPRPGPCCPGP